ncbi:MAG: hypothetical protein CM1200mP2_01360 [Planctomycetaceae bacterium]|nr:MAG: hypothetical protein CM1200mP2_01360 [Planctomycetaceae bacterium]
MMSGPPISVATSDMPMAHQGSLRPPRKKSSPVRIDRPIQSPTPSVPAR